MRRENKHTHTVWDNESTAWSSSTKERFILLLSLLELALLKVRQTIIQMCLTISCTIHLPFTYLLTYINNVVHAL